MGSMPLALSVHNFISSVGADAGFAAIIGLAILVLLYFAHARETANLREQAALLTQRLQQAEARVAQLTAAQPAAQPVPAPPRAAAAPVAARVAAAGALALPAAPAGVGAPALAAATRVVPLPAPAAPQPSPQSAAAPEPAVAAHAAPQPVVAPEAESVSAARTSPEPAVAVHAAQPLPGPGALTVAGENGNGNEPAAPPLGGAASAPGAPSRLQSRPATVVGNADRKSVV